MKNIDLKSLKKKALNDIETADNIKSLEEIFKKYLGKKGELALVFRSLSSLNSEDKIKTAKKANELKQEIIDLLDKKKKNFKSTDSREEDKEKIDITIPGKKIELGSLHPLTLTIDKIKDIFQSMGFEIIDGPEMETEWYNFDALNIPKDHPARDSWDTFWLENGLLLRTHTSPVQVRFMEKNNPPLRMITFGNTFRFEATDVSHDFQFPQFEGLMVGKDISVANLKAIIGEFFNKFFEQKIDFRLKPDYFPFTEPSFDISISCLICGGEKCPTCKNTGWLEVAGAGMVHPYVFKNAGLIPRDWQGWAFGFGIERLAMLKYKINDIRLFRSGDLRFLKQF